MVTVERSANERKMMPNKRCTQGLKKKKTFMFKVFFFSLTYYSGKYPVRCITFLKSKTAFEMILFIAFSKNNTKTN